MSGTEPTRERVEAYEKALGCRLGTDGRWIGRCCTHNRPWSDLGCEVAVAAARVEAERVAETEAPSMSTEPTRERVEATWRPGTGPDDEMVEKVARAHWAWATESEWDAADPYEQKVACEVARDMLAAVDLPAVRAEAERAGAARALREAASAIGLGPQVGISNGSGVLTAAWLQGRAATYDRSVLATTPTNVSSKATS